MYRIVGSDGTVIGRVSNVTYIKVGNSGSYSTTIPENATGIAFKSVPYDLFGHKEVNGVDTVVLVEEDTGMVLDEQRRQVESQLTDADEAVIELYETSLAQKEITAAQDDALIELYEMLGGGI